MRGLWFLPFVCFGLASCAHSEPGIEVRTVEVPLVQQVPCPGPAPVRPDAIGELPTDAVRLAATLGAKLLEWGGPGGFGDRAQAVFERCVEN